MLTSDTMPGCVVIAVNHVIVPKICLTSDTNLMHYAMFHCSHETASLEPEAGVSKVISWCDSNDSMSVFALS